MARKKTFGLTKKTDYGLELMITLGKSFKQGPVSLKEIAKQQKLPFKYLEQIAADLRRSGLVEAREGKGGGYFLTQPPKEISIAEVIEALEGPVAVGWCFSCAKAQSCGQKNIWSEVGDKVRQTIEGKTLGDLIQNF